MPAQVSTCVSSPTWDIRFLGNDIWWMGFSKLIAKLRITRRIPKLPSRRARGNKHRCSAINTDPHLRRDDVMKFRFCATVSHGWKTVTSGKYLLSAGIIFLSRQGEIFAKDVKRWVNFKAFHFLVVSCID